jgi:hypothetical protein
MLRRAPISPRETPGRFPDFPEWNPKYNVLAWEELIMTRLMCSKNRSEVESVKRELFRAGIRAQLRSNTLADAMRVNRIELWVEDERDFLKASKVYSAWQDNAGAAPADGAAPPDDFIEMDSQENARERRSGMSPDAGSDNAGDGQDELQEASSLLAKEIEEVLRRENDLAETCASLNTKVQHLSEELTEAQARAAQEKEIRAALEQKQAAEMKAVERQKKELAEAAERLEQERLDLQQQMQSRDEALKKVQRTLETKLQQLQSTQASVVELRKEIVAREQQSQEQEKLLAKARADCVAERDARLAAEKRAERAIAAMQSLETQLAEQKALQQKLEACVAGLHSLRSKLQAKRTKQIEIGHSEST